MTIINTTDEQFSQDVSEGVVLLDFWAPWCGPCKMLAPILDEVALERQDIRVVKLDVEENPITKDVFDVMSIPTLALLVDGELKEKKSGFLPKEAILDFIESNK